MKPENPGQIWWYRSDVNSHPELVLTFERKGRLAQHRLWNKFVWSYLDETEGEWYRADPFETDVRGRVEKLDG